MQTCLIRARYAALNMTKLITSIKSVITAILMQINPSANQDLIVLKKVV